MSASRPTRILLATLAGLVLLAVVSLAVAVWMMASTRGAVWSLARLDALLPGRLEAGEIRGSLLGPLQIRSLSYRSEGLDVAVERLSLDWRPRRLVARELEIREIVAEGVRVIRKGAADTVDVAGTPASPPAVDLPVTLTVHGGRIRDLQISGTGIAAPLSIGEIEIANVSLDDSLVIGRVGARSPMVDVTLAGRAVLAGDYPLAFDVSWTARLPGGPELSGAGSIAGSLREISIAQTLERPFTARADATVREILGTPRFEASLVASAVPLATLAQDAPRGRLAGRFLARGGRDDLNGVGTLEANLEGMGRFDATFRCARVGERWTLDDLSARLPGRARLRGRGELVAGAAAARLDFSGEWRNLVWPPAGETLAVSPRGSFRITGAVDRYRIEADAMCGAAGIPTERLHLAARGDTQSVVIDSLTSTLVGGRLRSWGRVAWKPEIRWEAAIEAEGIDPGTAWAEWPGRIALRVRARGRSLPTPSARFELDRLGGSLRGMPLVGAGTIELAGKNASLTIPSLEWGAARLTADGTIGESLALAANLEIPALDRLDPRTGGSLSARCTLEGSRAAPRVRGKLAADSLRLDQTRVAALAAVADLDLGPGGELGFEARALGIDFPGYRIDRVAITSRGPGDDHEVRGLLRAGADSLALELAGELDEGSNDHGPAWRGAVRAFDLESSVAGKWRLAHPAILAASERGLELEGFCWESGPARLCAAAFAEARGHWQIESRIERFPLSFFELFEAGLGLSGMIEGKVIARAAGGLLPDLDVELRTGAAEIRVPVGSADSVALAIERGTLRIRPADERLSAEIDVSLGRTGSIEGRMRILRAARMTADSLPIEGALRVSLQDLEALRGLLPELERIRGRVAADFALAGTLGEPRVQGTGRLEQGGADLPRIGVELRDVEFEARSDGGREITLAGSARSGPGRVTLAGALGVDPQRPSARITIAGRRFQAANTREVKLLADPDLEVRLEQKRLELTGQVEIPQGRIEIRRLEELAAIPVSDDVVILGAPGDSAVRADPEIHTRLRVVLGDSLSFSAYGLQAKPAGSLLVIDEPGKPTSGTGELQLREGTYQAYGQDLAIERGRLRFAGGSIENPGLAVRAARRAGDGVVAGFEVGGTLLEPELKIFSEPPMAEADALAYIVLGRPLEQATTAEGDLVTQAALSLGVRGGSLIASKLAQRVAIEEARLETSGSIDEAALLLGKYLSPRLYVNYGIGLFEPVSTLRVRYLLNRKWSLQVRTSEQSSADLMYSIER